MSDMKDLIFDLGGVLLHWDPQAPGRAAGVTPEEMDLLTKGLFLHPDWLELDRGTVEKDDVMQRTRERTGLDAGLIKRVFDTLTICLSPIPESIELLRELSNEGHRVFVISNMHEDSARYLENNYDFWECFNDVLFSCDVKLVKPDEAIFRMAFERFGVDPSNAVFFDDTKENVVAADRLGLNVIHFSSAAETRRILREKGWALSGIPTT